MPDDPLPRRKWLLAGVPICLVMTVVETLRAFQGHERSIAYMFEWPFFAAFLIYMYRKLGEPLRNWDEDEPQDE